MLYIYIYRFILILLLFPVLPGDEGAGQGPGGGQRWQEHPSEQVQQAAGPQVEAIELRNDSMFSISRVLF